MYLDHMSCNLFIVKISQHKFHNTGATVRNTVSNIWLNGKLLFCTHGLIYTPVFQYHD